MLGSIDDRRITAHKTEKGMYSVSIIHILGDGWTDDVYESDRLYSLFEELGDNEEAIRVACREFYQEAMDVIDELIYTKPVLEALREITEDNLIKIRKLRRIA